MPETTNPRVKLGSNNPPSNEEILRERHKPLWDRRRSWLAKAAKADLQPKTLADCAKLEELFGEGRDLANDADRVREVEKEPHLKAGREIDTLFNGDFRDKIGTDPKKGGLARQIAQAAADRRLAITRAEQAKAARDAEAAEREAQRLREQAQAQEDRGRVREADVTEAKAEGVERRADELAAHAQAPVAEASRDRTASGRSVSVGVKLECIGVVRAEVDLEALRAYLKQEHIVAAVQAGLGMGAFTTLKGATVVEKAIGRVR